MELALESGTVISNVTADDILALVEGEDFAILSDGELTYLQCAQDRNLPYEYVLEYQAGSVDQHYEAVDGPIPFDRVVAALLKYLRRDESWRSDFVWEKVAF